MSTVPPDDLPQATGSNATRSFEVFHVLGIPISVTTLLTASGAIRRWAAEGTSRMVCIRDVHGVMLARSESRLLDIHTRADMVTADGMPLVWIGRLGRFAVERTCGPDLMEQVIKDSAGTGLKHYFLGGAPGIAEKLRCHFQAKYPEIIIVGTYSPPFRQLTTKEVYEVALQIRNAGSQIVWIGLSTPKQEFLMDEMSEYANWTSIAVGAAFDFHAGSVKRAPIWMQRHGLEWLFRLLSEPRRLWRRYLVIAPRFVFAVAACYWRSRAQASGNKG